MAEDQVTTAPVDGLPVDGNGTAADNQPVNTAAPDKGTTIGGGTPDDAPVATPANWPENWREMMAGSDDKLLARLKRFNAPTGIMTSWREAEKKLSSGELKKALPKDATPEQVAEWRKENGLPEKPEDYKLDLGGIVPSEKDLEVLSEFKTVSHETNLPPDVANKLAKWVFERQEKVVAEQVKADKEFNVQAQVDLRQEWGAEYKPNLNAMNSFLDTTLGEEGKNNLFGARLADGSLLGDNPGILKWLAQVAKDNMPGAELVPTGAPSVAKGVHGRIAEIEAMQRTEPDKYWGNAAVQDEYLKLLTARDKMQSRAAA